MTDCSSWKKLKTHYEQQSKISLKQLFLESSHRFQQFSFEVDNLFFDYSKNWITNQTMNLLCELAIERKLSEAIADLFSGKKINYSEKRSALHTVFRLPAHKKFILDGIDLVLETQYEFQKMEHIAEQLEKKELKGCTGKVIDTILHIGMGGSGLGPALYYEAMNHKNKKATCHFLTKFDYPIIQATLACCNPETTIAIIVSKSFTTQETLTIFETIQSWLGDATHFYAVTEQIERAKSKGFLPQNILKMWDWVGGRYSIWSAVSFSVILALGVKNFKNFLAGAYQMDQHFQQASFKNNLPVIAALLSIWYNNFFNVHTQAIVPYSARLNLLPHYLQQLHMESLGKSVTLTGEKINYATGRVIWGDIGPNSQHSFHQLLMQGIHMIPVDFILPLCDGKLNEYDVKRAAYCLSQSQTLMQGSAESHSHLHIEGNRPSTTILMEQLTPRTFGALLALYEHKVFVQSVIWGINAFDQWGVECGKKIAEQLITAITTNTLLPEFDSSTLGLLEKICNYSQTDS